jgi:hypothetical protein
VAPETAKLRVLSAVDERESNPAEPVVYGVVGTVLFAVAAVAAWVAARGGTRVEPVIALKAE